MALYRYMYFSTKADMLLPDPRDPLTKQVPTTTTMAANEDTRPLMQAG